MLIGTMNQALAAIKNMNPTEISNLVWNFEMEGWYRENKRKTRSFCNEVVIFNWDHDRWTITRAIYNAQEN